jgi:hypothetical protein
MLTGGHGGGAKVLAHVVECMVLAHGRLMTQGC